MQPLTTLSKEPHTEERAIISEQPPVTPYYPGMTDNSRLTHSTTEQSEAAVPDEVKYLSPLLHIWLKLTDKELVLCLAVGLFFSILIDLPARGISSYLAEIITPIIIAIAPAVLITLLHSFHPGCLVRRLRPERREEAKS
jgi:hypothetical protein